MAAQSEIRNPQSEGWEAHLEERWCEAPEAVSSTLTPTICSLRSGVIGNTLGFDPRDSRFDPWLRNLRTWPNGSGACLRNKSMRVRVLPSAFDLRWPSSSAGSERLSTKQEVAGSSPAWVTKSVRLRWSSWNDSGLVNRRRWFESSTKLLNCASLV